jgi:hypothetical protein
MRETPTPPPETRERSIGTPLVEDPEELDRAAAVETVLDTALGRLALVVVVARGAALAA